MVTEEAFWEQLDVARQLIARYRERDGIDAIPGSGSLIMRLILPESGDQVSFFLLDKHAKLHVWPQTYANQIRRAGLFDRATRPYDEAMRQLFNIAPGRNEILRPISEIDLKQFVELVDSFIEGVLSSERID